MDDNVASQVLLVNQGTFCREKSMDEPGQGENSIGVYLLAVHYGFVDKFDVYGNWYDTNTIQVRYSNGMNDPVIIPIPSDRVFDHHLAYLFYFAPRSNRGERFQTETRYVNLDDHNPLEPNSRLIKLPIANYAPHPWQDSQYTIKVSNYSTPSSNSGLRTSSNSLISNVHFPGKIKYIWYGFTDLTEEEYLTHKEVPWKNSLGQFREEGVIDISRQQHHLVGDAAGKGLFMMNDLWIRLPNSTTNLVWKIGYEKFSGKPWENSTFVGYFETQTFFYRMPRSSTQI